MTYTVGDKGTIIHGQCWDDSPVDASGNKQEPAPVDITGTTITVKLQMPTGIVVNRAGTIVDAPTGRWKYVWADGDLSKAGTWLLWAKVMSGTTLLQTFGPVYVEVLPDPV